jgi:hypothetical protein
MDEEVSLGRKRWAWRFGLTTLLIALTAMCVGLAWWRYQHNRHSAVAQLRIRFSPWLMDIGRDASPNDEYEILCATQIDLMLSAFILNAAAEELAAGKPVLLNGVKSPSEFLRKHLQIEQLHNSEIVSLRFTASTPNSNEVKEALESICNAYLEASLSMRMREHHRVADVLGDELATRHSEINKLRETLIDLRSKGQESNIEFHRLTFELRVEEKGYEQMKERRDLLRLRLGISERISLVQPATIEW